VAQPYISQYNSLRLKPLQQALPPQAAPAAAMPPGPPMPATPMTPPGAGRMAYGGPGAPAVPEAPQPDPAALNATVNDTVGGADLLPWALGGAGLLGTGAVGGKLLQGAMKKRAPRVNMNDGVGFGSATIVPFGDGKTPMPGDMRLVGSSRVNQPRITGRSGDVNHVPVGKSNFGTDAVINAGGPSPSNVQRALPAPNHGSGTGVTNAAHAVNDPIPNVRRGQSLTGAMAMRNIRRAIR
jgi:hypothetical protein